MTKHMQVSPQSVAARPPLLIRRVDAIPVALPLKKPMKMAGVTIDVAENVLVRIEAAGGMVGWGEAASAPTMTGDTQGSRLAAALLGNSGAHSAIELALIDLAGRAAGLPAIDLIGGAVRRAVAPMWLLGNATPEH